MVEMAGDPSAEVKQILALPFMNTNTKLYDNAPDQFKSFISFLDGKITECREKMSESACAFAVNNIQNRFVVSEVIVEMANLFEILKVRRVSDFHLALDSMKEEPDTGNLIRELNECIARWDAFLDEIDAIIDEKIGPSENCSTNIDNRSPFAYLINESPVKFYLISIVTSFTEEPVKQYILSLYKKMDEIKSLGCEVYLLTRGPSIGAQGGSYLKLIGVPFRKICDENQAQAELKNHRQRAKRLAGWSTLLQIVEATIANDESASKSRGSTREGLPIVTDSTEAAAFIAGQHGCILVDKNGATHYKYVEEDGSSSSWPDTEVLMQEIKKSKGSDTVQTGTNEKAPEKSSNLDSASSDDLDKKSKCCTIL